jgi:hypothetical protein
MKFCETIILMKNVVFWDLALCRSWVNRRFGGASVSRFLQKAAGTYSPWFLARGFFYPEDGGDTFLPDVYLNKIYIAPLPRRPHSS